MELLALLSALLALAILAIVVGSVFRRGAGALNLDFFTQGPAVVYGSSGGGIAPSIVGTAIMVGMAAAMAAPMGILIAIYTTEFAPARIADAIRLLLNVLLGVPSIVIGVFVFGLLVVGNGQSAVAGAVGLAIIMLPLIARATDEVLALAPPSLREASLALGATRTRTVLRVVLPTSLGGILTGMILAVARAAGETAPLLLTSSIAANVVTTDVRQAAASIPITIFTYSESPSPQQHEQAWAAAFILTMLVLLVSITGRLVTSRSRRRMRHYR